MIRSVSEDHFKELHNELLCYLDAEHVELCRQAYELAEQGHAGQMRRSGEPYPCPNASGLPDHHGDLAS